jgi:hypothetical protein
MRTKKPINITGIQAGQDSNDLRNINVPPNSELVQGSHGVTAVPNNIPEKCRTGYRYLL